MTMNFLHARLGFIVSIFLVSGVCAQEPATLRKLELPSILSDGCVLQQNDRVRLWGRGPSGALVQVGVSWNNSTYSTSANTSGYWALPIPTPDAGGPYTVDLLCRNHHVQIADVMIGEVWVCSGQSNMEMPLQDSVPPYSGVLDFETEIRNANNPNIRLFTVRNAAAIEPQHDSQASWKLCTSDSVSRFSATGYFFGRELQRELGIPIGLISADYGGTRIESWMSAGSLSRHPVFGPVGDVLAREGEATPHEVQSAMNRVWRSGVARRAARKPLQWRAPEDLVAVDAWEGALGVRFLFDLDTDAQESELMLTIAEEVSWLQLHCNEQEVSLDGPVADTHGFSPEVSLPKEFLKRGVNTVTVFCLARDHAATREILIGSLELSGSSESRGTFRVEPHGLEFARGLDAHEMPNLVNCAPLSPRTPGALFNAMIVPIMPFGVRGVLWYQGESNIDSAELYPSLFSEMIRGWRKHWMSSRLSFCVAQIAPFAYAFDRGQAGAFRAAQRRLLDTEDVGLISTLDIGNPEDIHPKNKQEVGRRFALWALARHYGRDELEYSGPIDVGMVTDGDRLRIEFAHAEGGLVAGDKGVQHVEVAGEDGAFYPATTTFEGTELLAWSAEVAVPVRVRYCHGAADEGTLFNQAGLSAPSFERP